jgi:preprotein translocase subunit SecG
MFGTIVVLIIIVALFLMLIVLIQNPKGGGINSQFTGSSANQLFGVKKTTDLLEQITWGLAIAIAVFSLGTHFFVSKTGSADATNINVQKAQQKVVTSPTLPAPGAQQTPAPAQQPVQQPAK